MSDKRLQELEAEVAAYKKHLEGVSDRGGLLAVLRNNHAHIEFLENENKRLKLLLGVRYMEQLKSDPKIIEIHFPSGLLLALSNHSGTIEVVEARELSPLDIPDESREQWIAIPGEQGSRFLEFVREREKFDK